MAGARTGPSQTAPSLQEVHSKTVREGRLRGWPAPGGKPGHLCIYVFGPWGPSALGATARGSLTVLPTPPRPPASLAWAKPLSVPLCTIHFSLCRGPSTASRVLLSEGPGSTRGDYHKASLFPVGAVMRSPLPRLAHFAGSLPFNNYNNSQHSPTTHASRPMVQAALYIHSPLKPLPHPSPIPPTPTPALGNSYCLHPHFPDEKIKTG